MEWIALGIGLMMFYGVGIFVGYIMGYDRADRDNNDGWSTRTPF